MPFAITVFKKAKMRAAVVDQGSADGSADVVDNYEQALDAATEPMCFYECR